MKKTLLICVCFLIIVGILLFIFLKDNKKDNTLKIVFDDNGSTGFKWHYIMNKEGIVEVSSELDYSSCPKDVDGCGGEIIFTIKPLKEGEVTINFNLTAPNDEVDKIVIYNIKVDKDLKIEETHTDGK